MASLNEFGADIAEIIFSKDVYNLYKNRFLYWNEGLNEDCINAHANYHKIFYNTEKIGFDLEKVYFFRAVVHSLIERNFREEWDKVTFIEKYKIHIGWVKEGIFNANR